MQASNCHRQQPMVTLKQDSGQLPMSYFVRVAILVEKNELNVAGQRSGLLEQPS
jgi:hypothetical protein